MSESISDKLPFTQESDLDVVRPEGLHSTLYTDLISMLIWDRLGKLQAQPVVYTE